MNLAESPEPALVPARRTVCRWRHCAFLSPEHRGNGVIEMQIVFCDGETLAAVGTGAIHGDIVSDRLGLHQHRETSFIPSPIPVDDLLCRAT